MQNVRSHLFVDYGCVGALAHTDWTFNTLAWSCNSLSVGAGVALRLGEHGRAEINYCYPVRPWVHHGGNATPGLHLGIGVTVL